MASSIGGLGFASFIHAESEVALLAPGRAPAVSSNQELFAPAIFKTTGSGFSIPNKSHLMIYLLFSATAAEVTLSQDATFVVTERICHHNACSDRLLGHNVHQLMVGNVPALHEISVLEESLGLIILAGRAFNT